MDPHTFLRVHARLSGMLAQLLTPRIRSPLGVMIVLLGVLAVMHSTITAGNQECQDGGLCGKKDEGRQDDEMMQNPNPAEVALDRKDERRLDEKMMQNQTTPNPNPNPNPAQKALDKKDKGRQEDEMTQNQEKVNANLPGSQTQWQTGQCQRGNSQTQTQTQTQTHTETSTETSTANATTQSKPA